jgi:curved DNA-binding protein
MQYKDYYQALGVKRDATADEIKSAYRKLARKYHPDVSKEPDAEARMKEVNEAHTVLSDPEKRAAYDQLGQGYRPGQEFRPPPGWDSGFEFSGRGFSPHGSADFSDFFSELFGRMGGGAGGGMGRGPGGGGFRSQRGFASRGEDHRAKVQLDIEDSLHGATRQINLRVPRLDASGHVAVDTRTLNVKIPKGVRSGQTIRLAGQGTPGPGGTPAGDLLLEVEFRPHPRMTVDGADLRLALPVAPWEAALGAVITVDLPGGGALNLRIPEGTQGGRQLRVRGKGLPGEPPGDLLFDIRIALPPADTPKARELYETMARELTFDPRRTS